MNNLDISQWLFINGRSGERLLQGEAEERAERLRLAQAELATGPTGYQKITDILAVELHWGLKI